MNALERLNELQAQAGVFGQASPVVAPKFYELCQIGYENNAPLDYKTQQLFLLGLCTANGCEEGMLIHGSMFLGAGGTREELIAVLNLVVLAAGGPGIAHAGEALDIFDQLAEANK